MQIIYLACGRCSAAQFRPQSCEFYIPSTCTYVHHHDQSDTCLNFTAKLLQAFDSQKWCASLCLLLTVRTCWNFPAELTLVIVVDINHLYDGSLQVML